MKISIFPIKKLLSQSRFIIASIIAFLICGCSIGGDVVKVTTVEQGAYDILKEADRARLEQIKKITAKKGPANSLSDVIQTTPHFSVPEYLQKYPESAGPRSKDYRVGGYDVLNIVVYKEEDFSREAVRVSADGYISFPLISRIKVDKLTTSAIEKLISCKLAEGHYLLDSHVSVMVTGYNSKRFMVLGSVNNPGSYSLQAQERVLDAISRAGGIRRSGEVGSGKKAMIIRTENAGTLREKRIVINFDLQGLLQGKDQISNIMAAKDTFYIPSAEHYYIIGQVKNTGSYPLPEKEITLVEAIGMAGGFTPIAARNKTRIIIDTPPITAVTDAVVLAKSVDGVVLVIRANDSAKDIVKNGLGRLQSVGAHMIGAVLNGVDLGRDSYYYGDDDLKKKKPRKIKRSKSSYHEET